MLLAVLALHGCGKDDDGATTQPATVELDKSSLAFEAAEDEQSIVVTASAGWSVSGSTDWCTVSPATGDHRVCGRQC